MAYGLTDQGFVRKRLETIKEELESSLKLAFGDYVNLLPEGVFGQLVGIHSEREALLWELAEAVYFSQYPETAQGASLDNVVSLTGLSRNPATKSVQKDLLLFGLVGTLVPAGTQVSVNGNALAKFKTRVDVTLGAGVDEVQKIAFSSVPDSGSYTLKYRDEETSSLAFNANAAAVQAALLALSKLSGVTVTGDYTAGFTVTFGGDDGKQNQPLLILSASTLKTGLNNVVVTISELTTGAEQGKTDAEALDYGPTVANAFSLTVIDTPVVGLNRVMNTVDAEVGQNVETDEELRIRRNATLQRAGAGTVEAIRARLLDLDGVTDVIVFENTTDVTLDGRPPKCFEAVVNGGDTQEIAAALWETKPAGIQSFGTNSGTVVDSMGVTRTLYFSRPTSVRVYADITITKAATGFPDNGATLVETAIMDYVNGRGIGNDVIVYPGLVASLAAIPGIIDVVVKIGTTPVPTTDDNIDIAIDEAAALDSGDIGVTVI